MQQIRDSFGQPIFSFTMGSTIGSMLNTTPATYSFNLTGCVSKVFSMKNVGTTDLLNGSLWVSQDGENWEVIDGTGFNTLGAGLYKSSRIINEPRPYYRFTGSTTVTNVINIQFSASSFG